MVPLQKGALVDIQLTGFERMARVEVVMFDTGAQMSYTFEISGTVGWRTIKLPDFAPGAVVQLKAIGASSVMGVYPTVYSEYEYTYDPDAGAGGGDSFFAERIKSSIAHKRSEESVPKAVYINGHPTVIKQRQTIVVVWQGFPIDSTICVELRCPASIYSSYYTPAYAQYTFFEIINLRPKLENGCFVVAFECSKTDGSDLATLVRSQETYMLMVR